MRDTRWRCHLLSRAFLSDLSRSPSEAQPAKGKRPKGKGGAVNNAAPGGDPPLPTPEECAFPAGDAAPLAVGVAVNLALCCSEALGRGGAADAARMCACAGPALTVVRAGWLAHLSPAEETSRCVDQLFRLLFKGTCTVAGHGPKLAPTDAELGALATATLECCWASPHRARTMQVAARVASSLAAARPAAALSALRCALDLAGGADPAVPPEGVAGVAEDLLRLLCQAGGGGAPPAVDRSDMPRVAALSASVGGPVANVLSAAVHLACEAPAGAPRRPGVVARLLQPAVAKSGARLASPAGLKALSALRRATILVSAQRGEHELLPSSEEAVGVALALELHAVLASRLVEEAVGAGAGGDAAGRMATALAHVPPAVSSAVTAAQVLARHRPGEEPVGPSAEGALASLCASLCTAAAAEAWGPSGGPGKDVTGALAWASSELVEVGGRGAARAAAACGVALLRFTGGGAESTRKRQRSGALAIGSAVRALSRDPPGPVMRPAVGGAGDAPSSPGASTSAPAPAVGATAARPGAPAKKRGCSKSSAVPPGGEMEVDGGGAADGAGCTGGDGTEVRQVLLSAVEGALRVHGSGMDGQAAVTLLSAHLDAGGGAGLAAELRGVDPGAAMDFWALEESERQRNGLPASPLPAASGGDSHPLRSAMCRLLAASAIGGGGHDAAALAETTLAAVQGMRSPADSLASSGDEDLSPRLACATVWCCAMGAAAAVGAGMAGPSPVAEPPRARGGRSKAKKPAPRGWAEGGGVGAQGWAELTAGAAEELAADWEGAGGTGEQQWGVRPAALTPAGVLAALVSARDAAAAAGHAPALSLLTASLGKVAAAASASADPAASRAGMQALSGLLVGPLLGPWGLAGEGLLGVAADCLLDAARWGLPSAALERTADRYPASVLAVALREGGTTGAPLSRLASLAGTDQGGGDETGASAGSSASSYVHRACLLTASARAALALGRVAEASAAATRACGLLAAIAGAAAGSGPGRASGGLSARGCVLAYCQALVCLGDAMEACGEADDAGAAFEEAARAAEGVPGPITELCRGRLDALRGRRLDGAPDTGDVSARGHGAWASLGLSVRLAALAETACLSGQWNAATPLIDRCLEELLSVDTTASDAEGAVLSWTRAAEDAACRALRTRALLLRAEAAAAAGSGASASLCEARAAIRGGRLEGAYPALVARVLRARAHASLPAKSAPGSPTGDLLAAFVASEGSSTERRASGALLASALAQRGLPRAAGWVMTQSAGCGAGWSFAATALLRRGGKAAAGLARRILGDDDEGDGAASGPLPEILARARAEADALSERGALEICDALDEWASREGLESAMKGGLGEAADVVVAMVLPRLPGTTPLEAVLGGGSQEADGGPAAAPRSSAAGDDRDDSVILARLARGADGWDVAVAVSGGGPALARALGELASVLEDSSASMRGAADLESSEEKVAWWESRVALDRRVRALLGSMRLALGERALLALGADSGGGDEGAAGELTPLMEGLRVSGTPGGPVRPAVLVLDHPLQALPWEGVPGLRDGHGVYRCPSVAVASTLAGGGGGLPREIDAGSGTCVVNPAGDLPSTQEAFQEWLSGLGEGWWSSFGAPGPDADALLAQLQGGGLYVYMGHGAGDQLLPPRALRRATGVAPALLVGCSSGRLRPRGCYEAQGPVLRYLSAGAPAVVGTLWDVTDKDIDRFAGKVLEAWVGGRGVCRQGGDWGGAPEVEAGRDAGARAARGGGVLGTPAATPAKATTVRKARGGSRLAMMTPGGVATPAATPAPRRRLGALMEAAATGGGEGGAPPPAGGWEGGCVTRAVSEARRACRLPFLIGAAPVCYGVPSVVVRK